jgi:anti-sigma factor RsiW
MNKHTINDADLHAYVDGQLTAAQSAEVAAYLLAHPQDAERVRVYQAQNQDLRELFNPVMNEAVPERLREWVSVPSSVESSRRASVYMSRWSLGRIAAGIMIAVVSGVGGWAAHGKFQPVDQMAKMPSLPRQAAIAHVVYSPDVRRPVEVGADQEDQLVAWLSKRLGTPIHPPKLGALGYELIGGRLLPGNSGPVAQFMYHDATGQRLTLYVSTENTSNHDTAFRFAQEGPVNVFYWIDGQFGYALSAGIPKAELARIANSVYEQLERK